MARRKKWDPERMKAAIEAMRNEEMDSYKPSRPLNLYFSFPSITTEHLV